MDKENVWERASRIQLQTRNQEREALSLWLDGVDLLIASLAPLGYLQFQNTYKDRLILGFLAHGLNTQMAAFELAWTGFYAQALPLVRMCAEHWLAVVYLQKYPRHAGKFDPAGKAEGWRPPEWNDMLQKLAADKDLPEMTQFAAIFKGQRAWQNQLAHVDNISASLSWQLANSRIELVVGPQFHAERFRQCVSEFGLWILMLSDAARGVCTGFHLAAIDQQSVKGM